MLCHSLRAVHCSEPAELCVVWCLVATMDKDSHVVKYAVIDPLLNSTSQSTHIPVKVRSTREAQQLTHTAVKPYSGEMRRKVFSQPENFEGHECQVYDQVTTGSDYLKRSCAQKAIKTSDLSDILKKYRPVW